MSAGPDGLVEAEYERCRLVGCDLASARLRRVTLLDCDLVDCDLSLATFVDTRFVDCRLIRCRALGVAWSTLQTSLVAQAPFHFEDCRLDLGSLRGSNASGSVLRRCSMREVDLTGARLRGADLTGCDLTGATVQGTDLVEATLLDVTGAAIDPCANDLRGATFSVEGALELLGALGVVVR